MPTIVTSHLDQIRTICRDYGVQQLYLFGSAAHGPFDPTESDLDFQVDLGEYEPGVFNRYADFLDALQALFDRHIDLITVRSRGNDRFLREVRETRVSLYSA